MDLGFLQSNIMLVAGAGGVLFLVVVVGLILMLSRKPKTHAIAQGPPKIVLANLPALPPDTNQPHVKIYDTPVRIQYLVLAPVGAGGVTPVPSEYRKFFSAIDPDLADVIEREQPEVVGWPPQISAIGFSQAFFNQAALPGRGGQSTPWCAVAGKVNIFGKLMMCGMIGFSGSANGLGEITLEQEGQWREILRIGKSA